MVRANLRRAVDATFDPTVYPVDEKVGENTLHRLIVELLRPTIERWLAARGVVAMTGSDQFIYYRQYDAHARCSPDVYVLPGVPPEHGFGAWKTWEGVVPSLVVEVVSRDINKDYITAPDRYREMGVDELVIYDPEFEQARDERLRFQVYRKLPARGLVRVLASNTDRVRSATLGCHLVAHGRGMARRLRLATGRDGRRLVPSEAEQERAARLAAEAEVQALRAALRRRRR